MWRVISLVGIIILVILFFEMLFRKVVTLSSVKNGLIEIFKGIIYRFDQFMMGVLSHTRLINVIWGIGSLSLIWICTLRGIKIQSEVLILMGAAIGIGAIQAVKTQSPKINTSGEQDAGKVEK